MVRRGPWVAVPTATPRSCPAWCDRVTIIRLPDGVRPLENVALVRSVGTATGADDGQVMVVFASEPGLNGVCLVMSVERWNIDKKKIEQLVAIAVQDKR
jgi:hypothetical protein